MGVMVILLAGAGWYVAGGEGGGQVFKEQPSPKMSSPRTMAGVGAATVRTNEGGEAQTGSRARNSRGVGPASSANSADPKPSFDTNQVIEQVRAAFVPATNRPDVFSWERGDYQVEVAGDKIKLRTQTWRAKKQHFDAQQKVGRGEIAVAGRPSEGSLVLGKPFELETVAVNRERGLSMSPGAARHAQDGSLEIDRGDHVETLTNSGGKLWQQWRFSSLPKGKGKLKVRVAARGLAYKTTTDSGLHFAQAGGSGFAYSHATWVDATGTKTPITGSWDAAARQIMFDVPAHIVNTSRYPAVLDPTISAESQVDTPADQVYGDDQSQTAVAFDGTNYLAVWFDFRAGNVNPDVYAARIDMMGNNLDRFGILVETGVVNAAINPIDVASSGTEFMVVWETGSGPRAKRISSAGVVLDATAITIGTGPSVKQQLAIASNGSNYLVTWRDTRNIGMTSYDIFGTRVSKAGVLLDSPDIGIGTGSSQASDPAVASNGTDYLVTWNELGTIKAARVQGNGTLLDAPDFTVASGLAGVKFEPAVGSDGTDYLVAFHTGAATNRDIYAARVVAATGVVSDPMGIAVETATENQESAAVGFDGSNYVIAWADDRVNINFFYDIYARRMSPAGIFVDVSSVLVRAAARDDFKPDVVGGANVGDAFVVWTHPNAITAFGDDIIGGRLSAGTALDPDGIVVSAGSNDQSEPSIAFNGTNYLIVWTDFRNAHMRNSDIFGARVSADGATVLDPAGIHINPHAAVRFDVSSEDRGAHVASNGANFLVVWSDERDSSFARPYAARVSAAGVLLDTAGLDLSGTNSSQAADVSVASNGTDYLVVWADNRNSATTLRDIYANRVTSAGVVQDGTGFVVTNSAGFQTEPAIGSNGTNYLVAWRDRVSANKHDVDGARVSTAGVVLDVGGFTISSGPDHNTEPAVASDGTDFIVTLTTRPDGSTNSDISVRRVNADGTLSGALFGLAASAAWEGYSNIVYTGGGYVVTYTRQSLGLRGIRLLATGLPNTGSFSISSDIVDYPAGLAASANETALVAYHRHIDDVANGVKSDRILTRTVGWVANGGSCGTFTDCLSGFCVDNVCCDSSCGGGSATDCMACSTAAGGTSDGTCTALSAAVAPTVTCRAAPDDCDVPEVCVTGNTACPADGVKMAGVECNAASGACDVAETCNGVDKTCPADGVASNGTPCGTASCTAGTETEVSACDGTAKTCPAGMMNACAPYICGTTACRSSCVGDSDCVSGNYCNSGMCVSKLTNGTACTDNSQCTSNICADGVCCNSTCTGQCESCSVSGSAGTCSPVTGAPATGHTACAGTGTCGGSCDGTNRMACAYPDMSVVCRAGSCTGGTATLEASCDGAGSCPSVMMQDCAPNVCDGAICGGGCTIDTECVSGNYCSGGVCVPKLSNGDSCAADAQCTSNICTDGVCCDAICGGQCEACNITGSVGTCSPVTGVPVGGRAPCAGMIGDTCAGTCGGVDRNACVLPDGSVECSPVSCSADTQTDAAFCDGAGACNMPTETACTFGCAGMTCAECVVDTDCSEPQAQCMTGRCVVPGSDAGPGDAGGDGGPSDGGAGDVGLDGSTLNPDGDGGGCSCRVSQPNRPVWWPLGLALAGLYWRRRRQGRSQRVLHP